jgi:catechol 2,3-dioxygenase-like lactoylglutathione lyase family enzyme
MIDIESLHHVSVSVTDLGRAKEFYGNVLGLVEIRRPAFDFPGAWYRAGDHQLHLIAHPGATTHRNSGVIDSRDRHFALRVRNYGDALEHLTARGVPYRAKPENLTEQPQIYVADPDGNVIELNAERLD